MRCYRKWGSDDDDGGKLVGLRHPWPCTTIPILTRVLLLHHIIQGKGARNRLWMQRIITKTATWGKYNTRSQFLHVARSWPRSFKGGEWRSGIFWYFSINGRKSGWGIWRGMSFAEQLENEITVKYFVSFIALKVTYLFLCSWSCVPQTRLGEHEIRAWNCRRWAETEREMWLSLAQVDKSYERRTESWTR